MKKLLFMMLLIFSIGNVMAQDEESDKRTDSIAKNAIEKYGFKPSSTQFMIRGYAHTGFEYADTNGETRSTFDGGTFAPIFLFKMNDRFMLESELEFTLTGGDLEIGFEYVNMMYIVNDYLTVRAGKFLLPFGTFMERLHPSWINRFSSKPLGFGHGGIAPGSEVGVELRGAFYLGSTKWNWSGYITNGPGLNEGTDEPEEAGQLNFGQLVDNNGNKAVGGRLGFLPLSDSSLEVGGSFYNAGDTGAKGGDYEGVGAFLYAFDLSYVKMITPIAGLIDIKAQYNNTNVDAAVYTDPNDGDIYTFDNSSNAYYMQLSYRPTMAGNEFVKSLEFVTRYTELNTPEGSEWESTASQTSFGINYWLSWRSVLKFAYENGETVGGHGNEGGLTNEKSFSIHWAIGF